MENKRVNSKKLVLKVNLENGETRELTFVQESRTKNQSTCPFCPYNNVCDKIPHPEKLQDPLLRFTDLCTKVEEVKRDETNTIVAGYVPQAGTIEENLADIIDINKYLTSKKIYIPLDRVIDSVCADVCPLYTPDHSKCSSKNQLCILSDLFATVEPKDPDPEPVAEGEGVTETEDASFAVSAGPVSAGPMNGSAIGGISASMGGTI